jgi:16S rRNA (uracil1498-N3)-methyltransferase
VTELARFFLGPGQPRGNDCEIWGDDAHHITRVLRLRPGDEIECIDTEGLLHKVEITETGDPVRGLVRETESAHYEPPLSITLFQGLAKGDKMDWVVQKAVELGAAEVVPFSSRFTVVKLADKQRETRRQRWERIAVEAAKQCGRTRLPQVSPVLGWQELVSEVKRRIGEGELVLLAYEGEEKRTLSRITAEPSAVSIVIGPEGGFAPDEAELLAEAGVEPISLGPRILRTETAGVVALSLIGYRWGDLG